ncbi:Hypothetical predicted protein [Podarcis lilfordi]|uniref:Uncharacterized protein n=1 Tax=Podarcis lilfordi TaxID=74358 RepID=A0AA35JV79_9SAUR|nr:Hypothetical predicted protein [Podarcis lilfordi]
MVPFVRLVGQRPLAASRQIGGSVLKRNALSHETPTQESNFSLPNLRVVMSKNDDDQQFTIDNAIKNMDKMSSELNKLMVKTQLLLCDLILNFSHPALTDVSTEADEKKREESTNLPYFR